MSSGQEASTKADSYDNGAPRAADPTTALTDKERAQLTKILANPLDFPAEFPGWLDDFVRLRLTVSNIAGLSTWLGSTGATGELLVVLTDYTAQTGEYTITHGGGTYMYLNGATYNTSTYADLFAYLGTATLPDTRGRSLWLTGTNAAVDLFDNDGVAEASRQPKHTHSDTLALSGTPSAGTLDVSNDPHTHSYTSPSSPVAVQSGSGATAVPGQNGGTTSGGATLSITGAPGVGTLSVGGSVGSGMSGSDAVAHIVLGSAFVHV